MGSSKLENILKGSLDSIPSPSPSDENSNYGRERCEGKTMSGVVNELLNTNNLLTMPSNVLPLHLNKTFPPII